MEDMRSIRHCRRKHCTKLCGVAEDEELIERRNDIFLTKQFAVPGRSPVVHNLCCYQVVRSKSYG